MRRREFITLLGGAAAAPVFAPHVARAQPMPVIGFLNPGVPEANAHLVAAFRKGLGETGYVEGRNVAIEYRWAHNEYDRLAELTADLVRRQVAVIATPGGLPNALAARAATATIPILISIAADPVGLGLVASLSRPDGNVTGVTTMGMEIRSKLLALLHELMPAGERLAMLVDPTSPTAETSIAEARAAAAGIDRRIEFFKAASSREIDAVFASLAQEQIRAVVIPTFPLFNNRRVHIANLAARKGIVTICGNREYAEAGGLMSYGTNNVEVFRQVGAYAGRILKGEKPADLPVIRATKFEFVINLQTARTIDIEVPATLLAQADEVIE